MVEGAPPVAAPRERGWLRVLLALAAFLLLPYMPPFTAVLPVRETILLLFPPLAAFALVGWWAGGRAILALIWIANTIWLMWFTAKALPGSYFGLVRGWAVLLASTFGLLSVLDVRRGFFPRALTAVGASFVVGTILAMAVEGGPARVERVVAAQLERRNTEAIAMLRQSVAEQSPAMRDFVATYSSSQRPVDEIEQGLTELSATTVRLFPSLLALESLAALALAWALYHRLSRARIGPALGRLREFRFNDQLVWGLVVGLTATFLGTLEPFRGAGRNLLFFFTALYALRGWGVLAWFLAPRYLALGLGIGFLLLSVPIIGMFAALGLVALAIAAFGLGLSDTWNDWRRQARTTS
jgi:predicted membrane protein DUF2232